MKKPCVKLLGFVPVEMHNDVGDLTMTNNKLFSRNKSINSTDLCLFEFVRSFCALFIFNFIVLKLYANLHRNLTHVLVREHLQLRYRSGWIKISYVICNYLKCNSKQFIL